MGRVQSPLTSAGSGSGLSAYALVEPLPAAHPAQPGAASSDMGLGIAVRTMPLVECSAGVAVALTRGGLDDEEVEGLRAGAHPPVVH